MIRSFADRGTEDVYNGRETKRGRGVLPVELWRVARRKLAYVNSAARLDDLRIPPGNRLHSLERDRFGQHAIRINDQYRICFRWTDAGPEDVQIIDYH